MKRLLGFAMGLLLAQTGFVSAQGLTFSGSVSGELRYFMRPPGFVGQTNQRLYPSLTVTPRLAYDWNGGNDRLVLEPFLRLDSSGNGRGHGDLREAFWLHSGQNWSLTTGISKVFWGVTESRKLVDIINQDDAFEDIGGGAKLGQPMVNLSLFGNFGTLDLFVLPLFRERQFLATGARLAGPFAINPATYTSASGARNVDFAARWSQSLGSWDFALSRFRGTARAPRMVVAGPSLTPVYDLIDQTGLELQYTSGDWLFKLEAMSRSGQGPQFRAAVGGVEWTLPGTFGGNADLGLLVEYNRDTRDPALAPATFYDDDVFVGARLALNDIGDTSLLAGALIDRNTPTRVLFIEGQRRFGDSWVLGLKGRFFTGATAPDPIAAVNSDDFLTLTLKRSF